MLSILPYCSEASPLVLTRREIWNHRQMRYLCGRPSELKYDHKGDKIDQLGRLVGMGATYAAEKDEREGSDDAKRTNQVPALALSVPEMADGYYKILMYCGALNEM